MAKIIIDAEGAIFGRLCSHAAKAALEGNEVVIVNSEKAIISGNKENVIKKYKILRSKGGHSKKGPIHSKSTQLIMKRGIRGMLPNHREGIGKAAFSKIKCYDGVPKEFEGHNMIKTEKLSNNKFIVLDELSRRL